MKAYIEQPNGQYLGLFRNMGFTLVEEPNEADMIVFTGGADVSPSLYKHEKHKTTMTSPARDKECWALAKYAQKRGLPMVGICRGAQFLNVYSGGTMYQDVDNHAVGGTHKAWLKDIPTIKYMVSSTHHQMMRPGPNAEPLVYANLSKRRVVWDVDNKRWADLHQGVDIEAIRYSTTKSLCFQPHPEFYYDTLDHDCPVLFRGLLEKYIK